MGKYGKALKMVLESKKRNDADYYAWTWSMEPYDILTEYMLPDHAHIVMEYAIIDEEPQFMYDILTTKLIGALQDLRIKKQVIFNEILFCKMLKINDVSLYEMETVLNKNNAEIKSESSIDLDEDMSFCSVDEIWRITPKKEELA